MHTQTQERASGVLDAAALTPQDVARFLGRGACRNIRHRFLLGRAQTPGPRFRT